MTVNISSLLRTSSWKKIFLTVSLLACSNLAAEEPQREAFIATDTTLSTPPAFTPGSVAVDIVDLRTLRNATATQKQASAVTSASIPVTAQLYCSLLNALAPRGYDASFQLYSERAAHFITRSTSADGHDHYTVVAGEEKALLGALNSLDATKIESALHQEPMADIGTSPNIETGSKKYLFVKLGNTTNFPAEPELTDTLHPYVAWSETSEENNIPISYYWFKNPLYSDAKYSNQPTQPLPCGELWVSLEQVESLDSSILPSSENNQNSFVRNPSVIPSTETSAIAASPQNPQQEKSLQDPSWKEWWNHLSDEKKIAVEDVLFTVSCLLSAVFYFGILAWDVLVGIIICSHCAVEFLRELHTAAGALFS